MHAQHNVSVIGAQGRGRMAASLYAMKPAVVRPMAMKTAVQTIQEAFPMMKHPLTCQESLLFHTGMKHSTWALPTFQRRR